MQAAAGSAAASNWEAIDATQARLSAQLVTEVQAYGKAVVDPREYPRDSPECSAVESMAAAYGVLPPASGTGQQSGSQLPLVKAVNMLEGEGEFAGQSGRAWGLGAERAAACRP